MGEGECDVARGKVIEATLTRWTIAVVGAPRALLAIGFVATVACWIGYARCVLRPSPRADA